MRAHLQLGGRSLETGEASASTTSGLEQLTFCVNEIGRVAGGVGERPAR
jgi:hypothetical protein